MGKSQNLSGKRFGRLTVLEQTDGRENHYILWRCRCDCGEEVLVNTKHLTRGTITNCGCIPKSNCRKGPVAEDLTGQIFGQLTVLYRVQSEQGRARWACRCSCGKLHIAGAHELKAGKCRSCGCMARENGRNILDITGQRFGRLIALYPTNKRDSKGSVYWQCRCDCGTEIAVPSDRLLGGNCVSCGCRKEEIMETIHDQLHLVDGTCIEWLAGRKERCDNTSGFRGVTKLKNGRYRVGIGFKGKRYYVGSFVTYEEAVEARLEAEQLIHEGFLKAYEEWNEQASEDAAWAKTHPLVFEVEKVNGMLSVRR